MQKWKQEAIQNLNELIETCRESEIRFRCAAECATTADLKRLLHLYSDQRRHFVVELLAEIYLLGGHGHDTPGIGIMRPDFPGAFRFNGREEDTIISECARAEEKALMKYEKGQNLPVHAEALVSRQEDRVRRTLRCIQALAEPARILFNPGYSPELSSAHRSNSHV